MLYILAQSADFGKIVISAYRSVAVRHDGTQRNNTMHSITTHTRRIRAVFAAIVAAGAATTTALADLYVTPTGAGNKDGSSWANAFAGIQAAETA